MSPADTPAAPVPSLPGPEWEHCQLYQDVRESLACLPIYFRTETTIAGIMATDLHTLNTVLGATIEEQVVRTLNHMRSTWDPDQTYAQYRFIRQAQTFPDVLLQKPSGGEILLGIELKGWYLLAKEAEPSLRFQVTPAACALPDLVVVVPWVLGNVISGSPMLFEPFIESARFAAEFRNHYWQHVRNAQADSTIMTPVDVGPYPAKSDQILDRPVADGGGNFGRLARTGIMDEYIAKMDEVPLCGIKARFWRQFLKTFRESTTDEEAYRALERLRQQIRATSAIPSAKAQAALPILEELENLLAGSD